MEVKPYEPKIIAFGHGAVLDADGNEIAKVRIGPGELTPEQQIAFLNDNNQTPS